MKLCECGCGQATNVATRNENGYRKGEPKRFIRGHSAKAYLWPDGTPQAKGAPKRRTLSAEVGQRFGRGVVIETEVMIPRRNRPTGALRGARLMCDCGTEYVSALQALCSGGAQSCGCLRLERQRAAVSKGGSREARMIRGERGRPILEPKGEAPDCKCGCGGKTKWSPNKRRWQAYVSGHRFQDAPYKQEDWLREQYITKERTMDEMAAECGVVFSTIAFHMRKLGIPRRDMSDAHVGRQAGPDNPAWKGGVAKWNYAPEWKRIARKIRDRDKWTCQDCGEQRVKWGIHLHVHHIDADKTNNDPGNLISLCDECHQERHRQMAKKRKAA